MNNKKEIKDLFLANGFKQIEGTESDFFGSFYNLYANDDTLIRVLSDKLSISLSIASIKHENLFDSNLAKALTKDGVNYNILPELDLKLLKEYLVNKEGTLSIS